MYDMRSALPADQVVIPFECQRILRATVLCSTVGGCLVGCPRVSFAPLSPGQSYGGLMPPSGHGATAVLLYGIWLPILLVSYRSLRVDHSSCYASGQPKSALGANLIKIF